MERPGTTGWIGGVASGLSEDYGRTAYGLYYSGPPGRESRSPARAAILIPRVIRSVRAGRRETYASHRLFSYCRRADSARRHRLVRHHAPAADLGFRRGLQAAGG